MTSPIRLLIADDHPLLRAGLRQVIETDAQLHVVAEAGDGAAALQLIAAHRPDVAVLDIEMPHLTGFALLREMRAQRLATAVVFLTMYRDEEIFNEALDLGALGYVLKDSATTDIVAAIKAAAAGQPYISPAISAFLLNRATRTTALIEKNPSLNDLTLTERRVLKLIAENKTSKEIAAELFISYRTVENHRANICRKLDLKGSHSLLKFAFEHKSEL
ncbi:MAG TPA: response regulator transcription factor [Blastocatellia bacterium]|nr:response regulator transcription factor [Blastocatellia bacterium]HMV87532.1 response regulator transcription factor [Blastocatellia bacterium]HMX27296.1 response regulator transcription factor [Blastocatellia bacterium]HMZ21041.1 response regulator transcription factor [Blastocatellia bacterium]HNG32260.1 response regulator transcription factor [Blastocatellia bacterium]